MDRYPLLPQAHACLLLLAAAFGGAGAQDLRINEIMASNQVCCADGQGEFDDWIEIYNAGATPVDLVGMYATDDLEDPTNFRIAADSLATLIVEPGGFLLLWADRDLDDGLTHLDFGLRRSGEQVGLFAADGITLIDSVTFGLQQGDVSYGRQPDGGGRWFFLEDPSPARSNRSAGTLAASEPPLFSRLRGAYTGSVSLDLLHPSPRTLTTYTTDGSVPTRRSTAYYGKPIELTATTVVRARAFAAGRTGSEMVTHTFLIDEDSTLPVVAIATDPPNLWDHETGIYVAGSDNNFLKKWERPATIEYFEPDGEVGFAATIGLELHGGWSRRLPQKSLGINFRAKFGPERLDYRLFPDKPREEFREFILRNAGNDWTFTLMRDVVMQTLVKDRMDLDYQSYRPTIVFLNGQYWGIHNLRERINEHYLVANYGVAADEIDLLEERSTARFGEAADYDSLLSFLAAADMTAPETLEYVRTQVDVDNYIDYQVAEIFFANTDWPATNIEFWRRRPDGRWRWLLFDTDFGFNLPLALTPSPPDHNTLEFATTDAGDPYPNPPWATFLLRTLLEAPGFRDQFVQRMATHLSTTFAADRVVGVIDSLRDNVVAEIPRHSERWRDHPAPYYGDPFASVEQWEENLETLRQFARVRGDHVRQHLAAKFQLGSQSVLTLRVDPAPGGRLAVNGAAVDRLPRSVPLFSQVPFQVTAVSHFGYEFVGWSAPHGTESTIALSMSEDLELTARFAPAGVTAMLTTYPNPFNELAIILFQPLGEKPVTVEIYNSLGQRVKTLINAELLAPTPQALTWDTTDSAGRPVATGMYLCRLRAGVDARTIKLMLVR